MGAITALGDTLFPPESLVEGIRSDFSAAENFLVRLRWIHPILAVATAWYLAYLGRNREMIEGSAVATRLGTLLAGIVGIQIVAGVVNVVLLAPLWMQIVHLVLADATWILFVLFSSESLVAAGGRRGAEVQAA